jgi:pyrroloquinoline quinone (PQQ) biosynthesis protein C
VAAATRQPQQSWPELARVHTSRPPSYAPPDPFFDDLLAEAMSHGAVHHAFLKRFGAGKLSRPQLASYAAQQYMYSRYFARNLAAAIANVPDENARVLLVQNMYEEIGEPSRLRDRLHIVLLEKGLITPVQLAAAAEQVLRTGDSDPVAALISMGAISRRDVQRFVEQTTREAKELTHPALFRRFLLALGLSREALADIDPLPATDAMVAEYQTVCRDAHWLEAMGAMGPGTECVVPTMYGYVLAGIQNSGHVSNEDAVFWTIHVHCAEGHGKNIIDSMVPYIRDAEHRELIRTGTMRVLDARKRWFDALEHHVFG